MSASRSKPARLFLIGLLVISFLLTFSIQAAFATDSSTALINPTPTPASLQDLCEDHGGEWVGGANYKEGCVYLAPYRPYGHSGGSTTGPHWIEDQQHHSTTLYLEGEKNGYAVFPFTDCTQQCTISATLPRGAANDLPADAKATFYVRLVDFSGAPGTDVYWVCFDSRRLKDPAIYRYLQGEWVRITFPRSTNPFCTFVSLEGAFYLGNG